jgi:hypothetical protein
MGIVVSMAVLVEYVCWYSRHALLGMDTYIRTCPDVRIRISSAASRSRRFF